MTKCAADRTQQPARCLVVNRAILEIAPLETAAQLGMLMAQRRDLKDNHACRVLSISDDRAAFRT
jgi:hypothetical protein